MRPELFAFANGYATVDALRAVAADFIPPPGYPHLRIAKRADTPGRWIVGEEADQAVNLVTETGSLAEAENALVQRLRQAYASANPGAERVETQHGYREWGQPLTGLRIRHAGGEWVRFGCTAPRAGAVRSPGL